MDPRQPLRKPSRCPFFQEIDSIETRLPRGCKVSSVTGLFTKKTSVPHIHIFSENCPFFFPQRSPKPESPIPNTAPWFNEPRPFLYPIGFIIAKIKIAEPFRV